MYAVKQPPRKKTSVLSAKTRTGKASQASVFCSRTSEHPVRQHTGLPTLFGLDQWIPTGTPDPSRADFEALLQDGRIEANALMAVVPAGLDNLFEIEPRTQRGFKFEWKDTLGQRWHVHGHEPDTGAASGHVGAGQWVVRIQNGPEWLMSTPITSNFPPGHKNYQPPKVWSKARGEEAIARSHIPLYFA